MLAINQKRRGSRPSSIIVGIIAIALIGGGLYLLALVSSPAVVPLIASKPIDVNALPAPAKEDNRIIIPQIGVNIPFAPGEESLDRGAQWRYPERGNPLRGGNFIIAAHRFSIQPTPQATIEKSPFYRIDALKVGDKLAVDYLGTRYAYEIDKIFDVRPTQIEIEAPSETPILTLYSCELGGAEAGRVVITAKPLGKVSLDARNKSS